MAAAAAGYAAPEQLENVDVAIKRPADTWWQNSLLEMVEMRVFFFLTRVSPKPTKKVKYGIVWKGDEKVMNVQEAFWIYLGGVRRNIKQPTELSLTIRTGWNSRKHC